MLYNSKQAADMLGINQGSITRWVKLGWIVAETSPSGRYKYFSIDQINEAKKNHPIPQRKGFSKGRPKEEILAEKLARRNSIHRNSIETPPVKQFTPGLKPQLDRIEAKIDNLLKIWEG